MLRWHVHTLIRGIAVVASLAATGARAAGEPDTLPPYKMLQSLQFVQDSVVKGDHSAAEMQRFMLETIDQRLRAATSATFSDLRNVDAALIYAMSGGNPQTLEYLVARDVDGNFDSRVSDVLRKYLNGQGTLVAKSLGDMVKEYRSSRIAPYLALVAGNVTVPRDPLAALKFYDWARLLSPGTIVEEAALRRSLSVAVDADMVPKAFGYAQQYARRFLHSPYATQYADLLVRLTVKHYDEIGDGDLTAVLDYMDNDRRREVYLRIARQAAIDGKNDLARLTAERAKALSGQVDDNFSALADLYGGLANLSTAEIGAVADRISQIPDAMLTPSDRALRSAAEAVAREVLRMPEAASSAQVSEPTPDAGTPALPETEAMAAVGSDMPQLPVAQPAAIQAPVVPNAVMQPPTDASAPGQDDPAFSSYVDKGRSALDEIDSLLQQEGNP